MMKRKRFKYLLYEISFCNLYSVPFLSKEAQKIIKIKCKISDNLIENNDSVLKF